MFLRNSTGLLLCAAAFCSPLAAAQVAFSITGGPNQQFHRLFERVARSAFVAQGKVVERSPVWNRGVERAVQIGPNEYRSSKISEITGGSAMTIEISGVLCKQEDFAGGAVAKQEAPARVHVFVPYSQMRSSDVYPGMVIGREQLFVGKEYLLFLLPWPRQSDLNAKFELDPNITTWYRVFDGKFGARELPDQATRGTAADSTAPVVSALASLCEAAAPVDVAEKLARLRALQITADPRWKESIDAAIRALEAQQPAPDQR